MKTKLFKILFAFLALLLVSSIYGQTKLLYVANPASPKNSEDSLLIEYLIIRGYTITVVDAKTEFKLAPYDTEAAYADYDVVFISENVGSGDVNSFATAGFPLPCVTTEGYSVKVDKWDFQAVSDETTFLQISSGEATDGIKTLVISDEEHCITSIYEADDELPWTTVATLENMGVTGFDLSNINGAVALASYKDAAFDKLPTLWAIPANSTIKEGNRAGEIIKNNIVFFGTISYGMKEPTGVYYEIILRSLQWVMDKCEEDEEPTAVNSVKQYNLSVGPNPTSGLVNVSINLPFSEDVAINVYSIEGKLLQSNTSNMNAGFNSVKLDLSNSASSYYVYEIITSNDVIKGKICKK